MNEQDQLFIKQPTPLRSIIATLIAGILAAAAIGGIYGYIVAVNVYVYINVILPFATGALIGYVVALCAHRLGMTNKSILAGIALVCGLLCVYCLHVTWIHTELKVLMGESKWILNPIDMLAIMKLFASNGMWSFASITPIGWQLYVIWLIEAAIILWTCIGISLENPEKLRNSITNPEKTTSSAAGSSSSDSKTEQSVSHKENKNE